MFLFDKLYDQYWVLLIFSIMTVDYGLLLIVNYALNFHYCNGVTGFYLQKFDEEDTSCLRADLYDPRFLFPIFSYILSSSKFSCTEFLCLDTLSLGYLKSVIPKLGRSPPWGEFIFCMGGIERYCHP